MSLVSSGPISERNALTVSTMLIMVQVQGGKVVQTETVRSTRGKKIENTKQKIFSQTVGVRITRVIFQEEMRAW